MYDCAGPCLVFVTQTLHPILNTHTGYIFAEYDIHYSKPREMFFSSYADVQVFALTRSKYGRHLLLKGSAGRDWNAARNLEQPEAFGEYQLIMDPDAKPQILTAAHYSSYVEHDADYPDKPGGGKELYGLLMKFWDGGKKKKPAAPKPTTGSVADISYFGEE